MTLNLKNVASQAHLIWSDYRPTSLVDLPRLAERCGVARVMAKLENERPLGNFKALGGMYAGLWVLAKASGCNDISELLANPPAKLPRLICASDGNHGLAVAAAAHRVGAKATIYLHENVPKIRAERIAAFGANIIKVKGTYDDAVNAAARAVGVDAVLVSDTTDRIDDPIVAKVMEGYGLISSEIIDFLKGNVWGYPTHIFVQAGVGGLAAAMANGLASYPQTLHVIAVEPESAPCVSDALQTGVPELVPGALETSAEMLSCGLASLPAVTTLLRHNVSSVLVDELSLDQAPGVLVNAGGPKTTASGAAGLAGLIRASIDGALRNALNLQENSSVLIIITEGM